MPPTRNSKSRDKRHDVGEGSSSIITKKYKGKGGPHGPDNGVHGVQKIKASLRQTRRLLAKEDLAADVRIETERRLKSLEADLETAERTRKERTLALRYHKIKFFERQKVTRKIAQVAKQISGAKDKKQQKKLEETLRKLRVDLNYVLHYPKLKKYISLFPPEVRHGEADAPRDPKTDAEREEVRQWIREHMDDGELSSTPEQELESKSPVVTKKERAWDSKGRKTKEQDTTTDPQVNDGVEDDAFFGDDNDE